MNLRVTLSVISLFVFLPQASRSQVFDPDQSSATGYWTGIVMRWTAPGDDRDIGCARAYDIRYSTSIITRENYDLAPRVEYRPNPWCAGGSQVCYVSGLVENRVYCFALKTVDDAGNWSGMSNLFVARAERRAYICGDVNADGRVTMADITVLIGFVFQAGSPPLPIEAGNTNGSNDGKVTMSDIAVLISYVFQRGPEPTCQ